MEQEEVLCFRCGAPAIGKTSILTGTKERVPKHEAEIAVCENCYAVLKQKVKARERVPVAAQLVEVVGCGRSCFSPGDGRVPFLHGGASSQQGPGLQVSQLS